MTRILLAALLVLSLAGCGLLPTAPEPDCAGTCDGVMRQPAPADVRAAMVRARDRLRAQVEAGQIVLPYRVNWEQYPQVTWKACPFYVANADDSQTGSGSGRGMCAHGKTYDGGTRVMVSTHLSPLGTLEHEVRNSFLVRGGRADLAYRWRSDNSRRKATIA